MKMEKAMEWLSHPLFEFDDVGMPEGGVRVLRPHSVLPPRVRCAAVAMMARR